MLMPLRHDIADCSRLKAGPIAGWHFSRIQPNGGNLFTAFMYLYERFFIEARDTG